MRKTRHAAMFYVGCATCIVQSLNSFTSWLLRKTFIRPHGSDHVLMWLIEPSTTSTCYETFDGSWTHGCMNPNDDTTQDPIFEILSEAKNALKS